MPCNAPRIKSSSSTIATKFIFAFVLVLVLVLVLVWLWMAMDRNLAGWSRSHNHTLVCEASRRLSPWTAACIRASSRIRTPAPAVIRENLLGWARKGEILRRGGDYRPPTSGRHAILRWSG